MPPVLPHGSHDRRVVDMVTAGDARSDVEHGYSAYQDTSGTVDGQSFRQTRGWIRYALTTFDDTEVTIACTFLGTVSGQYDLVVDDSVMASRHVTSNTPATTVVEIVVPFVVTKGKTSIAVTLRARSGPTPRLHMLRTIQDHNEVVPLAPVQPLHSLLFPSAGVVR